jgi:hypothetical protein
LRVSLPKLGILAAVAAALLLLATMRPGVDAPVAEADLGSPGGIIALPSSGPGAPGVANQQIPAILGTAQAGIIAVWCDPTNNLPNPNVACPEVNVPVVTGFGRITFTMEQVYPTPGAVPLTTFTATGGDSEVVRDNSGADMDNGVGVVAVQIDAPAATMGGTQGVNEIVRVTATDEQGESRSVTVVVVDTILAWGPTGQVSTSAQEQPVWISYHCSVNGRSPIPAPYAAVAGLASDVDGDGNQGLDDMYDAIYNGRNNPGIPFGNALGWGTTLPGADADINDIWCGGNTGGLADDSVTFQTDKGILGVAPNGTALVENSAAISIGLTRWYPPILSPNCPNGQSINVTDTDALPIYRAFQASWPNPAPPAGASACDADGWRNTVVTTQLLGTGQVGVGTINAQQGGGISPVRDINVTFTGEAALSLFITAPDTVGAAGADFTATIVDQDGRPVGNESVTCTVSPTGAALRIDPQTGTTDGTTGVVSFHMVPTGASVVSAEPMTITCVQDSNRSVSATHTLNLSVTPETELVDLVVGCNFVSWTGADATDPADLAAAVSPASDLAGIWAQQPPPNWAGYSPEFPEVSDMGPVDQLDVISICMTGVGTFERPVV